MTNQLIQLEKIHDDRLWILTAVTNSREAVDRWEAILREYNHLHSYSTDRFLVYDLSHIRILGFTRYMRERVEALAKETRDASGRVAIVLQAPPSIVYVFDLFVRINTPHLQPNLKVRIFRERETAVNWVAQALPIQAS